MLLPEKVYVLAHHRPLATAPPASRVETAVAAAALAELRLRGRIGLDQEGRALHVYDDDPTGDDLLDQLLHELGTAAPQSPYEWLLRLRAPVTMRVVERLQARGLCELLAEGRTRWEKSSLTVAAELRRSTRDALRAAILSKDFGNPAMLLGFVLWGAELAGSVLGPSFGIRRRLGKLAAQDWIGLSIRSLDGYIIWSAQAAEHQTLAEVRPADETADVDGPGHSSPIASRPRRRWGRRVAILAVSLAVGAFLASAPYRHQRGLDERRVELHRDGVLVSAEIIERQDEYTSKARYLYSRVVVSYELRGYTYREEVLCEKGCREQGQTVQLWVALGDPDDFVTEWGDHNESRRYAEWVGWVGWSVAAAGLFAFFGPAPRHRRWRQLP